MNSINIDIFCKVIDNFGDAGVCMRLASQFNRRGHHVRIYTDQAAVLHKICPDAAFPVYPWYNAVEAPDNGLVIESFACELPDIYKATIKTKKCVWLNLEYLSAETWVESYHKMPSPQQDGTVKYFFFPGFTSRTGSLLRDENEIGKYAGLSKIRLSEISRICKLADEEKSRLAGTDFFVFLFCYPDAPLAGLQEGLAQLDKKTNLLLAGGSRKIENSGNLHIINVPFIGQTDFDRLLWLSDLNFIRGEDSLAQSCWTGKPTVWQAYVQTENTHIKKLAAWLDLAGLPDTVNKLIQAWNKSDNPGIAKTLPEILQTGLWEDWQKASMEFTAELRKQTDLVSNLELFYKEKTAFL